MPIFAVKIAAPFAAGLLLFRLGVVMVGLLLRAAASPTEVTRDDRNARARPWRLVTGSRLAAVGAGVLVTAAVQSSGAVTAVVVQVAGAGLVDLRTALCLVLGANVGTTATAHLVAFEGHRLAQAVAILGVPAWCLASRVRTRWRVHAWLFAGVITGVGVMLSGLSMMSDSVAPLVHSPTVVRFLAIAGSRPLAGVLAGAVVSAVTMSSTLTTGIVVSLCADGIMSSLDAAVPLILGANIGTCATAAVAAIGAGAQARRVAAAHLAFNVLSAAVCLCLLESFTSLVAGSGGTLAGRAAAAHTLFNLMGAAVALPVLDPLARLLQAAIR